VANTSSRALSGPAFFRVRAFSVLIESEPGSRFLF
jgi:hypothetical protein